MLTLDIGVACNKVQQHEWWAGVMGELLTAQARGVFKFGGLLCVGSASPDWSKNRIVNLHVDLTDANRNAVVAEHLEGVSDGIMWLDDDTVPMIGTIKRLSDLWDSADVIGGVYRKHTPPFDVIGYKRLPNGAYLAVQDFQPGEIIEMDAVGMGCTLVKRSVYERIRDAYVLMERAGQTSLVAVHKDDVREGPQVPVLDPELDNLVLAQPGGRFVQLVPLQPIETFRAQHWPFYLLEHERTEDLYFCEMAKRVGCQIVLDTGVVAQHWAAKSTDEGNYRDMMAQRIVEEEL